MYPTGRSRADDIIPKNPCPNSLRSIRVELKSRRHENSGYKADTGYTFIGRYICTGFCEQLFQDKKNTCSNIPTHVPNIKQYSNCFPLVSVAHKLQAIITKLHQAHISRKTVSEINVARSKPCNMRISHIFFFNFSQSNQIAHQINCKQRTSSTTMKTKT